MLTKTELETRFGSDCRELPASLYTKSSGTPSAMAARRLRRQRRETLNAYRAPTGWSVRLW